MSSSERDPADLDPRTVFGRQLQETAPQRFSASAREAYLRLLSELEALAVSFGALKQARPDFELEIVWGPNRRVTVSTYEDESGPQLKLVRPGSWKRLQGLAYEPATGTVAVTQEKTPFRSPASYLLTAAYEFAKS